MGRAQVRAAIQEYIQGSALPYVGTVYPARPEILDEWAYTQMMNGQATAQSAEGSAAVLVVNLPSDRRQRQADTGRGAVNDWNIHETAIEIFFASASGDAVAAQQDYDTVVDALVVAVRANPTPGGSAVVWSAGEFSAGVRHEQSMPTSSEDGLTILINGLLRYDAYEWVAGTGV